jgi:type VI secretion system secreted protein VgrG
MPASITFDCGRPAGTVLVESLTLQEGLSEMGVMQLQLYSPQTTFKAADLLGKAVGVTLVDAEGNKRFVHGHVVRFSHCVKNGRLNTFLVEVRPWTWFLTRTANCRIFQAKSVPDIVKKVCNDHAAVAKLQFNLMRSYRKWDYCVQYRETDFQFITRLLEHEGIYWWVKHEQDKHTLVLMDASSAHNPIAHDAKLPYLEDDIAQPRHNEPHIASWASEEEIQTEKVVLTSYDFMAPSTSLLTEAKVSRQHPQAGAERFDFQGDYTHKADGKQLADDLLDGAQTAYKRFQGVTNVEHFESGCLFDLTRHPLDDQKGRYLITRVGMQATIRLFDQAGANEIQFKVDFNAIPAAQQFRPPRQTPKPFVQGPQTAVVVGPDGEEIYTDKYGRVKVQFHWERPGEKYDKFSCWVRVSHPWAGKNFGMIHTPRIGQEVVVSFLEGDPDQPLITGRVYNAEQMPPWELPANATQSGILTRSSKGGAYGNANAIRFEDKKGSEQLWIHAEKNQDIEVENDETHWVGHDRTKTIDHDEKVHVKHDRTETVDNNESITIGVDRKEQVGSNETISIGKDRKETVGANETISIGSNRTEDVGSDEKITIAKSRTESVGTDESVTIGASRTHTVGSAETITVGADQSLSVGAARTLSVGSNQSVTVGADHKLSVGGAETHSIGKALSLNVAEARTTSVGKDDSLTVGKNLTITAADSITLKTGSASITMKKDGTITIKGKDITLDGSGKINAKASGDVILKGSKITQN